MLTPEQLLKNLQLEQVSRLEIPEHLKHPDYFYRVVNNTAARILHWQHWGYQVATLPELVEWCQPLHGGTDDKGRGFGVCVMFIHKAVQARRNQLIREKILEQREGLEPQNRAIGDGKYAKVDPKESASDAIFAGQRRGY